MHARPAGDVVIPVQQIGHLAGIHLAQIKGDDAGPPGQPFRRIDMNAGDIPQPAGQKVRMEGLLGVQLVSMRLQKAYPGQQPGDTRQIQRAGFQAVGHIVRLQHQL